MKTPSTLFRYVLFAIYTTFCLNIGAQNGISLLFNRTGTTASTVQITVADNTGTPIPGASATLTSSHNFKATAGKVTAAIVCPNVNGNSSPKIRLVFNITGIPTGFEYNQIGLDLHALNGSNGYQNSDDGKLRQFNLAASIGNTESETKVFATLKNFDAAAGVYTNGTTHKLWKLNHTETFQAEGNMILALDITKGNTNEGCFLGLSEVCIGMLDPETDIPNHEHTQFAKNNQIYELPCGVLTDRYLTRFSIEGEGTVTPMQYPLNGTEAARPSYWYTLYTHSQAKVKPSGEINVNFSFNQALLDAHEVFIYADWNRDGVFETTYTALPSQGHHTLIVPTNAQLGKSRLRLRLTENGMKGAEEDVTGHTFDCIIHVVNPESTAISHAATVTTVDLRIINRTLTVEASAPVSHLEIYDAAGHQLISSEKATLHLPHLPVGSYVAKVTAGSTRSAIPFVLK